MKVISVIVEFQSLVKVIPQNRIALPFFSFIDWLLPGHSLVLQTWDCKLFPWQAAPPFLGGGLAQVRERV